MQQVIEIPALTDWQTRAVTGAEQYNLVCAGRQSGKSMLIIELIYEGITKGSKMALLFPTYKSLYHHWQRVINTFFPAISAKNESRMQIDFHNGASLETFSAESADTIRGNQFDIFIIDEAAHIQKLQTVIEEIILPTLLARHGSIWMLSTPKGTQHYFNECMNSGLWKVTRATSFDNPYLDPGMIEKLKLTMSPERVQQELLGIPVDEQALVPFFFAYNPEVHFTPTIQRDVKRWLYFSFDFNVGLMSCVVAQYDPVTYATEVLALIQLQNSSVQAMCRRLSDLYPDEVRSGRVYITGDASGNNRTGLVDGNISYYVMIRETLRAKEFQLRVPRKNMDHAQSQQYVNAVINSGFVRIGSPELNRQMKALTIDDSGIVKDGNDHGTDCLRYLIHTVYHDFLAKPRKYLTGGQRLIG